MALKKNLHSRGTALGFEQVDDVLRGTVTKELAERFLMVGNAMLFDQSDEVRRRVAGQRGLGEVFVRGNEILRLAVDIRKITAPAAGDEDFLADSFGTFQHPDTPSAFAGLDCAEESRGAGAENQSVKFALQE